jgi:hypothetical protein
MKLNFKTLMLASLISSTNPIFASQAPDPLENSLFKILPGDTVQKITNDYLDPKDVYNFILTSKKLSQNTWEKDFKEVLLDLIGKFNPRNYRSAQYIFKFPSLSFSKNDLYTKKMLKTTLWEQNMGNFFISFFSTNSNQDEKNFIVNFLKIDCDFFNGLERIIIANLLKNLGGEHIEESAKILKSVLFDSNVTGLDKQTILTYHLPDLGEAYRNEVANLRLTLQIPAL